MSADMSQALVAYNAPRVQWNIIALTRNAVSESAVKLASLAGVTVSQVERNHMEDPSQCLESLGLVKGEIYGVFSNQGYVDDITMIRQGEPSIHLHPLACSGLIF